MLMQGLLNNHMNSGVQWCMKYSSVRRPHLDGKPFFYLRSLEAVQPGSPFLSCRTFAALLTRYAWQPRFTLQRYIQIIPVNKTTDNCEKCKKKIVKLIQTVNSRDS